MDLNRRLSPPHGRCTRTGSARARRRRGVRWSGRPMAIPAMLGRGRAQVWRRGACGAALTQASQPRPDWQASFASFRLCPARRCGRAASQKKKTAQKLGKPSVLGGCGHPRWGLSRRPGFGSGPAAGRTRPANPPKF